MGSVGQGPALVVPLQAVTLIPPFSACNLLSKHPGYGEGQDQMATGSRVNERRTDPLLGRPALRKPSGFPKITSLLPVDSWLLGQ